jgi:GNAT superfamily N-acetyltransferase/catechol 2,3-dioxygenase-like lactoylglutathione lyase family enzyme
MKIPDNIRIRRVTAEPEMAEALADVLLDCVEGGASIGFMHPLPRAKAIGFWEGVIASAARGERILLVAEDVETDTIIGTVQVILTMPDNQPHRADVAKMQVHRRARRRGVGAALMRASEAAALEAGRTLLVLDTVTGSDAERLYTRLGWQRCGEIPGYALWPRGGFCSTTVFYRVLNQSVAVEDKLRDVPDIEVIGIDHIYIAVSDLARAEKYYDRVMDILGFRKNTFPNDGQPHIQYYNRHFGFVIRPARSQSAHDSFAPGMHHFCFRVEDPVVVDAIARRFEKAGVSCTPPQLYPEYAPDYYATFFADPDGMVSENSNGTEHAAVVGCARQCSSCKQILVSGVR